MISFFVAGVPIPKGSTRAFYNKVLGRAIITAANSKTRPWEQAIRAEAKIAGCAPTLEPVEVLATFYLPRPKGHFGKAGTLRPSAPLAHDKKPDIDKLLRALLDGLTGEAFVDDAQVVAAGVTKQYANSRPGVSVRIIAAPAVGSAPSKASLPGSRSSGGDA